MVCREKLRMHNGIAGIRCTLRRRLRNIYLATSYGNFPTMDNSLADRADAIRSRVTQLRDSL